MAFWKVLKQGYDHFEVTRHEPKVDVCEKNYVFDAEASGKFSPADRCPAYKVPEEIAAAVREKQRRDDTQTADLINRGTPAVAVKTGIDGGMNATFLAAVKSHGGPGATIRTAAGTIPPHVNPPAERETAGASMGSAAVLSLASAESRLVPAPNSTVQVASAAPASSGGVGSFFSKLFGSKSEDQGAAANVSQASETSTSKSKRTAAAKPGQSAAGAPRPKPEQPGEAKSATAGKASAPKDEKHGEPERNTASTTGVLNGAAPSVPSGGFDNRFGAWN
jgi:hypothetical protein